MAEQTQMLSHWHHSFQGLKQSSQEFYSAVETAVQEREIPGVQFSRVEHKEGAMFSAKREYLRIKRNDLYYDICGAPFGNGFFVSARLFVEGSFFERTVGGNSFAKWIFKPDTFYKQDTALMYQELVHNGLLDVVDKITSAQNLRPLGEGERTPVMREFYQ